MHSTIGNDAIKISLIQTLPGEEFSVALALEKACAEAGLEKFAIFKGFGSYDIIFIHAWHDFSSLLPVIGPINGILKTTKYFCYHYSIGDSAAFFKKLNDYACAAIIITKICNEKSLCCYASEHSLIEELTTALDDGTFFFGTLGWSELIVVSAGNNLSNIVQRCTIPSYGTTSRYIQKTYSIIAINYRVLPSKTEWPNINDFTKLAPSFNVAIIKDITPIITITCFPGASNELLSFWSSKDYTISDLIGKEDVQIIPELGTQWINVIHDLFIFRKKFNAEIYATTTYISYSGSVDRQHIQISHKHPLPLDYDYENIKNIFNDRGLALADALNTLNGLIKNKIISDAFEDMARYHKYLQDFALQMDPNNQQAMQVLQTIQGK